MRYPVELTPDDNDTILAIVPDVPGVHSFGDDEREALARVADALEGMLGAIMADRENVPLPSDPAGRPTVTLPALAVAKISLYRAMREAGVGKAELARRLGWHLPQVDRVLDLRHASRLDQVEAALRVLGQELYVEVRPAA